MDEIFALENLEIFVNNDHRFGTDALLLAEFAEIHKNDIVCDLCTGCGIIPMFMCKKDPPAKIYGVELQDDAVRLFAKSVEHNRLSDRVFPVQCDLCDIKSLTKEIPHGSCSIVTVNPPYFKQNSGETRLSEAQKIARHELCCTLEDVISTAAALLKYGGSLKICHIPERLCDVFCLMRAAKIEPKRLMPVQTREDEKPWLVLVDGKKGGKPGLVIEKTRILQNRDSL